jgi:hypothetical protein
MTLNSIICVFVGVWRGGRADFRAIVLLIDACSIELRAPSRFADALPIMHYTAAQSHCISIPHNY